MTAPTLAQRIRAAERCEKAANQLLNVAYWRWHDIEERLGLGASQKAYMEMEECDRMSFVWFIRVELLGAEQLTPGDKAVAVERLMRSAKAMEVVP